MTKDDLVQVAADWANEDQTHRSIICITGETNELGMGSTACGIIGWGKNVIETLANAIHNSKNLKEALMMSLMMESTFEK